MSSAADPEPGTVVEDADPPGIIARPTRCDCAAASQQGKINFVSTPNPRVRFKQAVINNQILDCGKYAQNTKNKQQINKH